MTKHMDDIAQCYLASVELFSGFERGLEQFQEWTILGQIDIEGLSETCLQDVNDWERNFRSLKIRGQSVEKLPR